MNSNFTLWKTAKPFPVWARNDQKNQVFKQERHLMTYFINYLEENSGVLFWGQKTHVIDSLDLLVYLILLTVGTITKITMQFQLRARGFSPKFAGCTRCARCAGYAPMESADGLFMGSQMVTFLPLSARFFIAISLKLDLHYLKPLNIFIWSKICNGNIAKLW